MPTRPDQTVTLPYFIQFKNYAVLLRFVLRHRRVYWANIGARRAVYAKSWVYYIDIFSFGYCVNRTFTLAGAAGNAFVFNNIGHLIHPLMLYEAFNLNSNYKFSTAEIIPYSEIKNNIFCPFLYSSFTTVASAPFSLFDACLIS